MKYIIGIALSFFLSSCSLLGLGPKRAPEIVPSCFSDGENQATYCKSQRVGEDRRIITTRCIGTKNLEAKANLRGKCVEKICSEGSNTDCQVRGEFPVLEQYAELVTAKLFAADEDTQPQPQLKKEVTSKDKEKEKPKGKAVASVPAAPVESTPAPKKTSPPEEASEKNQMQIVLKPAKKSRIPSSVKENEKESKKEIKKEVKKLCIAKSESSAPETFRGQCATRICTKGKCTYKGKKEVFEWAVQPAVEAKTVEVRTVEVK